MKKRADSLIMNQIDSVYVNINYKAILDDINIIESTIYLSEDNQYSINSLFVPNPLIRIKYIYQILFE